VHQLVNKNFDVPIEFVRCLGVAEARRHIGCMFGYPALGVHKISAKLPRTFNYSVIPSPHCLPCLLFPYFFHFSHFISLCLLLHSLPYPLISFFGGGGL